MHTGGFGWKSKKSGQVIAIPKSDLKQVEWLKIPHAYQLKLRIKGGFVYMFNGLKNQACPPDIAPPPIAAAPARPLLSRSYEEVRCRTTPLDPSPGLWPGNGSFIMSVEAFIVQNTGELRI